MGTFKTLLSSTGIARSPIIVGAAYILEGSATLTIARVATYDTAYTYNPAEVVFRATTGLRAGLDFNEVKTPRHPTYAGARTHASVGAFNPATA